MRLWRSAVVALALSSAAVAVAAESATARKLSCGALRGTAVYGITAEGVRCPEARALARAHARSVKRRGACAFDRPRCRVRKFTCSNRLGLKPRPRDGLAICGDRRFARQVVFRYDARKIRLPKPPRLAEPPQASQPPQVPAPGP